MDGLVEIKDCWQPMVTSIGVSRTLQTYMGGIVVAFSSMVISAFI